MHSFVTRKDAAVSESSGHFEAPPIATADLAFVSVFLAITLVQFGSAIVRISRISPGHRPPALAVIITLTFLALAYVLGIALIITSWSADDFGQPTVPYLVLLHINLPMTLFWDWVDAAVFAAVALTLHDRYLTPAQKSMVEQTSAGGVPLLPFTVVSSVIFILIWVFRSASVGVWGSALTSAYNATITRAEMIRQFDISNDLFYVYLAVSAIAIIFLLAFAIVVWMRNRSDKITKLTLMVIVPILTLRAAAHIIVTILRMKIANDYSTSNALEFSSDMLYGIFHAVVMTVMVYFVMVPRLWDETSPFQQLSDGYPLPQQTRPKSGVAPPAQSPEQWAYAGEQQPTVYPPSPVLHQPPSYQEVAESTPHPI